MLVTRHTLAHELTALNLLTRAAIVDGGFRVQEQIGRHRVFTVTSGDGARYLVKQATPANDTWKRRTISSEAKCLRFAADDADLRPHVPALIHLNEDRQLLIQEFIDGPNLYRDGIMDPASRQKIAAEIGETLATVHHRMLPMVTDHGDAGANRRLPWILTDNRPWLPGAVGWKSPVIGLAAVLRQFPDIDQSLAETGRHWREDAWIHHDIKPANMIRSGGGDFGRHRIVIVDWELARRGDLAWDLAAMVASYLSRAIGIRTRPPDTAANNTPSSRADPLGDAAERTAILCHAYLNGPLELAGLHEEFLRRCLRYTGARLIQSAYEAFQAAHRPTANVLLFLQAGLNMMRSPDDFGRLVGLTNAGT